MNTTYLIYRPVLDYEESMDPLLTCATKARAEDVRQELIEWCIKTEKSLPQRPQDEYGNHSDEGDEVFFELRHEAVEALRTAKYPFDLPELWEVFSAYHEGFTHNPETFLAVMEIPLV